MKDLQNKLDSMGINVFTEEIKSIFGFKEKIFGVRLSGGEELSFGIAFSTLEFYKVNNDLALMLGGKIDEDGYIVVDGDCRVLDKNDQAIPGLYAIGDVTPNWKQIMVGLGDADKAVLDVWTNYL